MAVHARPLPRRTSFPVHTPHWLSAPSGPARIRSRRVTPEPFGALENLRKERPSQVAFDKLNRGKRRRLCADGMRYGLRRSPPPPAPSLLLRTDQVIE